MSASGFNVIRKHSLDATGVRIKELTQALATARSNLEGSQLETDDVRSLGRMDHSTIKLNDERLSFGTIVNSSNTDFYYEFPSEPDLKYLKVWFMLDHLGARLRDTSGFKNDAYIQGHPTLRRALLDLGFQQLPNSPGTAVMLFNSGTDAVSKIDGEYVWIPDNETIQFTNYPNGFSIHFRFSCLNFAQHYTSDGGRYSRRFASKSDDANNGWAILVNDTGGGTGSIEFNILHNGIEYSRKTVGYAAGMWYQVVITYDPTAGGSSVDRIKIYTGGNENSMDSDFGILLSTTFNLRIGARSSGTGFFHGYIHDYRMWMDKVLTQDEITNLNQNELTIDDIPKGHVFVVQYALVQFPVRSAIHKFGIVGRIIRVKAHRFNIVTRVELTNIHKWHVKQRVLPTKRHIYTIVELVKRLLTVVYDQGGALVRSSTHKWHAEGKITRTHTHKWNVIGPSVALTTQYVRFTKNTTAGSNITQDITFNGKPQALIVWSEGTTSNNAFNEGYQMYYGFSDGTNHGCVSSYAQDNVTISNTFSGHKNDRVISMMNTTLGTVASEATVSFIDTNTARFNWTTNDNRAVYIHCLAIWGVTAAEVKTFDYGRITTGNQTYTLTNSSLLPKFIHTITRSGTVSWSTTMGNAMAIGAGISSTKRWSIANTNEDNRTTSSTTYARGYYTESSIVSGLDEDQGETVESEANVSSFSTGQFVLNWTNAPISATSVFTALVLDTGANTIIDVGSFSEPASTGTQNITVASTVNQVNGVMIFSNGQSASGITTDAIMSVGAGTGTGATDQGCVSIGDDDVGTATRTARINKTGSIIKTIFPAVTATDSTTSNEASLSALGTDQFTLNWATRSGTRRCHYIVFGEGTDTTPPTITDRSPSPDATGISVSANIVITFSEAMDPNYVGGTWFQLRKTSDMETIIGATETLSPSNVVTINPTVNMDSGTSYTMTVVGGSGGVRDVAGNPLSGNVSWSWTTASGSYTEVYNVTSDDYGNLGSINSRFGERFLTGCTMIGITPKRITMRLSNASSLTGTAYLRIRNSSDTVVSEFGSIDVSTIGTSEASYTITNDNQSHTISAGDRILLEYTHANNNIRIYFHATDSYSNANRTQYTGTYNTDSSADGDMAWIIYY